MKTNLIISLIFLSAGVIALDASLIRSYTFSPQDLKINTLEVKVNKSMKD